MGVFDHTMKASDFTATGYEDLRTRRMCICHDRDCPMEAEKVDEIIARRRVKHERRRIPQQVVRQTQEEESQTQKEEPDQEEELQTQKEEVQEEELQMQEEELQTPEVCTENTSWQEKKRPLLEDEKRAIAAFVAMKEVEEYATMMSKGFQEWLAEEEMEVTKQPAITISDRRRRTSYLSMKATFLVNIRYAASGVAFTAFEWPVGLVVLEYLHKHYFVYACMFLSPCGEDIFFILFGLWCIILKSCCLSMMHEAVGFFLTGQFSLCTVW